MRALEELTPDCDRATDAGADRDRETNSATDAGTQTCLRDSHRVDVVDHNRRPSTRALEFRSEVDAAPSGQQVGGKNNASARDPSTRRDPDRRWSRHA